MTLQHSRLYSYADDAQLSFSYDAHQADQTALFMNCDLDLNNKWSMDHGVKHNIDKCALINFSGSRSSPQ